MTRAYLLAVAVSRSPPHKKDKVEDSIRAAKDRPASSNAELVSIAVAATERHGRKVATPAEARAVLGIGEVRAA